MMNLGDGPVAVMSVNARAPHQEVRPGEMIGPFKLVDVNSREITLEWDGKVIHKLTDEMEDRTARDTSEHHAGPNRSGWRRRRLPPRPHRRDRAAIPAGVFAFANPTTAMPVGTVADGYRKNSVMTLFGPQCRWEPVGR